MGFSTHTLNQKSLLFRPLLRIMTCGVSLGQTVCEAPIHFISQKKEREREREPFGYPKGQERERERERKSGSSVL